MLKFPYSNVDPPVLCLFFLPSHCLSFCSEIYLLNNYPPPNKFHMVSSTPLVFVHLVILGYLSIISEWQWLEAMRAGLVIQGCSNCCCHLGLFSWEPSWGKKGRGLLIIQYLNFHFLLLFSKQWLTHIFNSKIFSSKKTSHHLIQKRSSHSRLCKLRRAEGSYS